MNKKPYSQVFDVVAYDLIPDSVDLAPRIITHIQKRKGAFVEPKLKLLMAALAVVTVFIVFLANGPAVVRALQNLFGYIPGLGTVESDGSLRTLAERVSQTREGITITVEQGSIDDKQTILLMTIAGWDPAKLNSDLCFLTNEAQLRLSDGTKLKLSNSSGPTEDREFRYYFPALPAGSNEATLEIPCLWFRELPKDWEIPLRFEPATGMKPLSIIEVSSDAPGAQTTVQSSAGIWVTLEQVVPLEDGYIFMGNLNWGKDEDPNTFGTIAWVYPDSIHAVDANGKEVDGEVVQPDITTSDYQTQRREPWAFKVPGKEHAWPLTLKMSTMSVSDTVRSAQPPTFEFDAGSNPQVGQVWPLDQSVMVNGYMVHVSKAYLVSNPYGDGQQLVLEVALDPDVVGVSVGDVNSGDGFSSGYGISSTELNKVDSFFLYPTGMSSGPHLLTFSYITYLAHGNWQVTWQP